MISQNLVLHIGPHKTGTTSLQTLFSGNMGLLEKHSLYYPKTGLILGGHHNLAWEILLTARFNPNLGGWTQLFKEFANLQEKKTIILSSEDFSLIPVSQLSQIFQPLAEWNTTILCVYRPLKDFIESYYAEEVKNGKTCLSLKAFTADKIVFDQRVKMDTYFSLLIDNFGVKIKVIPYKGDVIPPVTKWLGLPPVTEAAGLRQNTRVGKDDLRRILAHRRLNSDLDWLTYHFRYVSPYLSGKAGFPGEMAPEDDFVLGNELTDFLAAQDERNISFFNSHEKIDYS